MNNIGKISENDNKIIHYIWIKNKDDIPASQKKIMNKTISLNSEFSIKIWDLNNINDLNIKSKYFKKAITEKKWAFASDYLRAKILYEYGGVYIDIDLYPLKKLIEFLEEEDDFNLLIGFEYKYLISTGFIWAKEKNNLILKKLLEHYDYFDNFKEDKIKFIVNNYIWTNILVDEYNLKFDDKKQYLKDKTLIVDHRYFSSIKKIRLESYFLHKHLLSWKKNDFMKKIMMQILAFIQEHKILNIFLKIEIKFKLRRVKNIYKYLIKNER
ncbi:glycosyltransferase family 32 protein [Candidatus Hepatoplasma crinochetorum]|jgi:mannosyltransferase OCH1-like enzyme|uniref:Mannosyltransferase OCH1 n=1 Tax=Candidatus Hepatoplasma crinochetorum Av TaxID=1427984 RepID=W8GRV2_9MOLU|nr:glycosyltransferase [Candidatus Hepatoplasma crinochetorum]AHK22165.1 Mannosyltransferase OCH1 [Candidatus Hepatoplasma crinochetorum Av]BDV02751.1 MAG: hypothetical protein HCTKY_0450 [Candidatus Hepatoplasma crinochetorum]